MSKKKTQPNPAEGYVPCCGNRECFDCPAVEPLEAVAETLEGPVEDLAAPAPANCCYTIQDGDSWASIASRYKPAGTSTNTFAQRLVALNGGPALRPGKEIKVNPDA